MREIGVSSNALTSRAARDLVVERNSVCPEPSARIPGRLAMPSLKTTSCPCARCLPRLARAVVDRLPTTSPLLFARQNGEDSNGS